MVDQYIPLSPTEHNRLRFQEKAVFSFASEMHVCPLLYTEVSAAGRFFPIVFPTSDKIIQPLAIFSIKPGVNPFVSENGSWTGGYLPRKLRLYPFALARKKGQDKGIILVDKDAPQFGESGKLLYTRRNEGYVPAPLLKQAKEALIAYEEEAGKTAVLCRALQNAGVLSAAGLELDVDGRKRTVRGFSAVDWAKVVKLDDATLANWTRSGLIQLALTHLQSIKQHF